MEEVVVSRGLILIENKIKTDQKLRLSHGEEDLTDPGKETRGIAAHPDMQDKHLSHSLSWELLSDLQRAGWPLKSVRKIYTC